MTNEDTCADILCAFRQSLHNIRRKGRGLGRSIWKHRSPPHYTTKIDSLDRRDYKKPTPRARNIMCVRSGKILAGSDRVIKLKELLRLEHLSENQKMDIEQLLVNFADRFYLPGDIMPATNVIKHEIPITNHIPIRIKQFRRPPILKEEINRQVNEMLEKGIVEPSTSAYPAPVFCVDKKPGPDGKKKYRVVVDFRKLNAVIPDSQLPGSQYNRYSR